MTQTKVDLGHYLFYDRKLSGNESFSCASCHVQRLAFSDPRTTALGSTGMHHPRRTPTLTNVGYATILTWANPTQRKLERQMLVPIFGEHPVELGLSGKEKLLIARLAEHSFHNTGLYNIHGTGEYPPDNMGVYEITGLTKDIGAFKAPTLRNVAVRALALRTERRTPLR